MKNKSKVDYDLPWAYTSIGYIMEAVEGEKTSYGKIVQDVVGINVKNSLSNQLLANALVLNPFPITTGFNYAGGREWRYIEVAARLRLLFNTLYYFAERHLVQEEKSAQERKLAQRSAKNAAKEKGKEKELARKENPPPVHDPPEKYVQNPVTKEKFAQNKLAKTTLAKENLPPKTTYLDSFFDYLENYKDTWTRSRIPTNERELLKRNQRVIDRAIRENPQTQNLFMATSGAHGFDPQALEIPKYTEVLDSTATGPMGPVSLEVAFILALQFAGVDVAALAVYRRNCKDMLPDYMVNADGPGSISPPRVFTCASFIGGQRPNQEAMYDERLYFQNVYFPDNMEPIHTTTRTIMTGERNVSGTGVYVGIDLFHGLVSPQGWPEDRRYFNFSFHVADVDTHPTIRNCDMSRFSPFRNLVKPKAVPTGGSVWPHCHQGFWGNESAFHRMFHHIKDKTSDFKITDALAIPRYDQIREGHIYILAEEPVIGGSVKRIPDAHL